MAPISSRTKLILAALALGSLMATGFAALASAQGAEGLEAGFVSPPDSAKPHTWWHWMDGNITKEGITQDLEEMKRVGVGGAQIFDVAVGIPRGPVRYGSDEWRAMVKHAAQEADRLGLELCMHNCAGWSSSGGPWITPELAMQIVTFSERRVKGPGRFEEVLAQPPTKLGFYRDIALLAFPTPEAEVAVPEGNSQPQITASDPQFDASKVTDGNPDTQAGLSLRPATEGESPYILLTFAEPFTARALTVLGGSGRDAISCDLEVSEDGVEFRRVARLGITPPEITRPPSVTNFDPVSARFYRLVFPQATRRTVRVVLAEVRLEASARISNLGPKAGYVRGDDPAPDSREVGPEAVVKRSAILDLTSQMNAAGRLTWDVPEGDWTILRIGHTPTGKENHPAAEEGRGLECDKLSKEAVDAHWAGMMGKVVADLGPLTGKSLRHVLIDSYEVGPQNWTAHFREEFQTRRGYDPLLYLPVMAGRMVDSMDVSERFLWDVRRTIADLFADNYYGRFATLCHERGLQLSVEPYGNGGFDDLTCGGRGDIPMGEFWVGSGNDNWCSKLASSAAHTYGRKYVGAEAFTASAEAGRWQNHPYAIKALGDLIYTGGINRFIFHRYAHQPWLNVRPGMTMGPWGMHFERTVTWWDQSPAWLTYLARCQYLLQSGLFAADLCYFTGEGSPKAPPARGNLRPAPPAGYDYDACNAEVLLTRLSVEDGRLVLPDGMSYRVLVLPPSDRMTPEVLRKVRDLIRAGATVVGPRPTRSPSLTRRPDCDAEVRALADEIWADCDGERVKEHKLGQGVVIWGRPLEEVLAAQGLKPDFEFASADGRARLVEIHRTVGEAEVYFVSNQNRRSEVVDCTFRVSGKVPELWHPDTGKIERAPLYRKQEGRTTVTLRLDPAGSVFVVFRQAAGDADHLVSAERDGRSALFPKPGPVADLQIRRAVYGVLTVEQPDLVDVTEQLRALVRDNRLSVRADNAIAGDPAPNVVKQLRVEYTVDGQPASATVDEGAMLTIPAAGVQGKLEIRRALYGILPPESAEPPKQPWVDVTEKLAALVQDGALTVVADNLLAGDPAPLVVKQMLVEYTLDGEPYTKIVRENQTLQIPDGTEKAGTLAELPAAELAVSADGKAVLTAWEPGLYELTTAGGKKLQARVEDIGAPVEVSGPWELRFPPNLGAPEKVTLEALASWTKSEDPGVRYFSGTATYVKQVVVPQDLLGVGKVLLLDLGKVREIAEVRVNGRDLGILWKPPFRVEVTDAVKPGANLVEIRVTNLWPNRLIGDEQLPADIEWTAGGALKEIPRWVSEGTPRPEPRRVTFTTWRHWAHDSPLLDSGLLGPVTLRLGQVVTVGQ